jgi:cytidine deaminase
MYIIEPAATEDTVGRTWRACRLEWTGGVVAWWDEEAAVRTADELVDVARKAAQRAHVPYSHFPVGAAVVGDDGEIYEGCNIESASYGLTCCAERVGMFNAVAHGAKPVGLAVTCLKGDASDPNSLTPCGACRQVMLDLMGPDAPVIIDRLGEFIVSDLLPKGFQLPE